MSKEFKAPRDLNEIHREYSQLCARAGDLQYKINAMNKDLAVLNNTLSDLNFEAVASNAATEKAKSDAALAQAAAQVESNVTPISQEK